MKNSQLKHLYICLFFIYLAHADFDVHIFSQLMFAPWMSQIETLELGNHYLKKKKMAFQIRN